MRYARLAALAGVLLLSSPGSAAAAAPSPCDAARDLVGAEADGMSESECQAVVDGADEETWQLWLDMARAHENAGDHLSALQHYQRFIAGVGARARPLDDAWARLRDDAQLAVARLDGEVRAVHGRVTVTSTPDKASATFAGQPVGGEGHVTPFDHYLPPGGVGAALTF